MRSYVRVQDNMVGTDSTYYFELLKGNYYIIEANHEMTDHDQNRTLYFCVTAIETFKMSQNDVENGDFV